MDKVLKFKFSDSKDDIMLYNWLITHENMEDLIKETLMNTMRKDMVMTNLYSKYEEKLKCPSGKCSIELDNIESAVKVIMALCE